MATFQFPCVLLDSNYQQATTAVTLNCTPQSSPSSPGNVYVLESSIGIQWSIGINEPEIMDFPLQGYFVPLPGAGSSPGLIALRGQEGGSNMSICVLGHGSGMALSLGAVGRLYLNRKHYHFLSSPALY